MHGLSVEARLRPRRKAREHMIALAHLKKFVADHPHYFPDAGKAVLENAELLASSEESQNIMSGVAEELLGKEHAAELFRLISTNRKYLRLSFEAARKADRNKNHTP